MPRKSYPARFKAATEAEADGLDDGQFEAIVSVFNNVDVFGDVVMPGAFTDTLDEWSKSGRPIPVYYSHRLDDPRMCIGEVVEAKETDDGLYVKAQIDLDDDADMARAAHRSLKRGRLAQFSFTYDVLDGGFEKREKSDGSGEPEEFFALRKLKLFEVGPTPIGANQETELLAVKHDAQRVALEARSLLGQLDEKAGRVLSAKNEQTLRDALDALDGAGAQIKSVLSALDSQTSDDGKSTASAAAKHEDHTSGKCEEPTRMSPASVRLRCDLAEVDG